MGKDVAASDNFIWFPSEGGIQVKGETWDKYFVKKGAFEVFTYKFTVTGEETTSDADVGVSSASGKGKFGTFTFTKYVDTASIPLYRACCKGTKFPTIMLATRKAGGSALIFWQHIFRYNQITGVEWSGGSGEERPQETITFIFKAMGVQYIPQGPDGREGVKQYFAWNISDQGSSSLDIKDKSGNYIEKAPDYLAGTSGT
jgi:type VI secretion system secreted protein Hcp